jgi:hypothetical protein
MYKSEKKLRKVNANILQEANPPKDGSRALEWRKSFNYVNFSIKKIEVVSNFFVNEKEFLSTIKFKQIEHPKKNDREIFDYIKPNTKIVRRIEGVVDECKDLIYELLECENEESVYKYERPESAIRIQIKELEELEKNEIFPNGVYYGSMFRFVEKHEGSDCFYIECTIPPSHMDELLNKLSANPHSSISASINLLSFTSEVEDSLGEYWMSKRLLIESSTYAIIDSIHISEKSDSVKDSYNNLPEEISEKETEARSNFPRNNLENLLSGVVKALWVIAIALIIHLFK